MSDTTFTTGTIITDDWLNAINDFYYTLFSAATTAAAARTALGVPSNSEAILDSLVTTTGDMIYASSASTPARLAIGTARQQLATNSGATAPEWVASLQSLMTGTGDLVQSSSANTPARLAIGTARQQLAVNSGATAVEYVASLQSLMTGTGDIVQSSSANTPARLAIGTAGQALTVNSGATAAAWGSALVLNTAVATTSGTAVTVSSTIPSWINRMTLNISGLSSNGTQPVKVQLGTGGSATTSGYVGSASVTANGVASAVTNPSDGFHICADSAGTYTRYGSIVFTRLTGNTWIASGNGGQEDSARIWSVGGEIALAGALDFMRITADGVDTFDAGSVSLMWE